MIATTGDFWFWWWVLTFSFWALLTFHEYLTEHNPFLWRHCCLFCIWPRPLLGSVCFWGQLFCVCAFLTKMYFHPQPEPTEEDIEKNPELKKLQIDPLETVRQKCAETEHCVHTRERLEHCETRVGSRSSTLEDCTEELFDFLHARDHCVSIDRRRLCRGACQPFSNRMSNTILCQDKFSR